MFNSKHEGGKEGSKKRMKTFRFKSFPCNSLATSPRHDCEPSRGGGVVQIEFARGGGDENSLSMINSRDFAVSLFRYYSSSLPHFSLSLSQLSRPFSVPFFFFLLFSPPFFSPLHFSTESYLNVSGNLLRGLPIVPPLSLALHNCAKTSRAALT